jgi:hypothetical protein
MTPFQASLLTFREPKLSNNENIKQTKKYYLRKQNKKQGK